MQKSRKVLLGTVLNVGGKEISEVIIRASTVGDEEDAMQEAINLKKGNNNVTVELCLMAKLTRLPYDAIRSLPGQDYQKLKNALAELNGIAGKEPENPTMTDGTDA